MGCSWNVQALLARNTSRQTSEFRKVSELLGAHDFIGLQEIHSNEGGSGAAPIPGAVCGFWCHGQDRQDGVVLLLNHKSLRNFNVVRDDDWECIELGRAVTLRLRGPSGRLGHSRRLSGIGQRSCKQSGCYASADFEGHCVSRGYSHRGYGEFQLRCEVQGSDHQDKCRLVWTYGCPKRSQLSATHCYLNWPARADSGAHDL